MLPSFQAPLRAAVFGASGGIGGAVVAALAADPAVAAVYAGARRPVPGDGKVIPFAFDLTNEASIAAAFTAMEADGPLDLIFVATGVLHAGDRLRPEKTFRSLDPAALTESYAINAIGPALIAKHGLPRLAKGRKAVFAALSARVGSISDNNLGGWHSYRAAKAALNQLLRTMAIELAGRNPTASVLALHPGTVDTGLSKPFQSGYGAGSGKRLQSPEEAASALLSVIDARGPAHSGGLYAWDNAAIPY